MTTQSPAVADRECPVCENILDEGEVCHCQDEPEDEVVRCWNCAGSGEGLTLGSRCWKCRGWGEIRYPAVRPDEEGYGC